MERRTKEQFVSENEPENLSGEQGASAADCRLSLSLIVPVFNSVQSLPELTERVAAVLVGRAGESYELIFVDDASSDPETWPMLQTLAGQHVEVRAIQLMRNFGRTGAVLAGITAAKGRWLLTMDDDLQHRPEDIPELLCKRDHDVVLAQFSRKHHGLVARIGSRLTTWLEQLAIGMPPALSHSPFLLIKSEIARQMLGIQTPSPFLPALYLAVTRDLVGVAAHDPRHSGESTFSLARRIKNFSNLLINNSALMMRAVAFVGIVMATVSVGYGCYLLIGGVFGTASVPGWTSLMVVTLVIGGLILLSLGVIGEYLIRIIRGVESRPAFVVRREID
jgi:dolichol-phosphate mannosyltransferase/undecaprenyl-phosphate 4-deoxy-4-formamido-L-arabinose transferase